MHTILGGNGTIGQVLAKELSILGNEIRLVSRNPKKVNETDNLFPADLTDEIQVDKAIAGSEVVYLLIGFDYNLKFWQEKWPKLMRCVLNSCIKHKSKLVFFDNVYLYDKQEIPNMTEYSKINPPSEKGKVRKEIAGMMMEEITNGKLSGIIARSADFYGPKNEKSFLIEVVYKNFKKGKAANWFSNPDVKHSFTYTPDAARATAILGNSPIEDWNQVWHLPTDPNTLTGREWTTLFSGKMNVKNKISVLPTWLVKIIGWFVPFMSEMPEMMYQYDQPYFFDSSKFTKRFGMSATPYSQGVEEIIKSDS